MTIAKPTSESCSRPETALGRDPDPNRCDICGAQLSVQASQVFRFHAGHQVGVRCLAHEHRESIPAGVYVVVKYGAFGKQLAITTISGKVGAVSACRKWLAASRRWTLTWPMRIVRTATPEDLATFCPGSAPPGVRPRLLSEVVR